MQVYGQTAYSHPSRFPRLESKLDQDRSSPDGHPADDSSPSRKRLPMSLIMISFVTCAYTDSDPDLLGRVLANPNPVLHVSPSADAFATFPSGRPVRGGIPCRDGARAGDRAGLAKLTVEPPVVH